MLQKFAHRLASTWRNLLHKKDVEQDLREEIASYLDLATRAKIREGLSEDDARRAALLGLEGVEQVKEQVRQARCGYGFELLAQDFRYAARTLRKAPAFSFTVIAVLALGLGSTAIMFALVQGVLLKGPPFPQSDRLFTLWQRIPTEERVAFSPNEFLAWQKQSQVFERLAFSAGTGFTITGRGDPELLIGRMVAPSFFNLLGVRPALGRVFAEGETDPHLVVLTQRVWREKFSARPDALGESLLMNGEPYEVIGVLPENFAFDEPDGNLFVPALLSQPIFATHPDAHFLRVLGRLKPDLARAQLEAEIDLLGPRVDPPDEAANRRHFTLSDQELTTGHLRRPLGVLLSAVALLFLIACANVANLTLARGQARMTELSIRAALGASRPRLIAQLLTESVFLALLGGGLGLGLAWWGLDLLRLFASANLPELARVQIDAPVVALVFALSTLAVILIGLLPAFSAVRSLAQGNLNSTRSTDHHTRLRQLLVFAEVAIASLLLVTCALMLRSFSALVRVDPGFEPAHAITAGIVLAKDRTPGAPEMIQFAQRALEKIRSLPAAQTAGFVTHLPFAGNDWGNGFEIEGQSSPPGVEWSAQIRPISRDYFRALGIPMKDGRDFSERDHETASGVAIVNELLAQRFWPNESSLGHRLRYNSAWLTVVGVAGNIRHSALDSPPTMEIYVPYAQVAPPLLQFVGRDLHFVVRTDAMAALADEIRQALRELDPQAVVKVNTMEALIRESTVQVRFRTALIGIFSGFALALACLGVYGVIAYLVTQRYREIGLRLALGATRRNILALILGRTFWLALAGIAAGLLASFFLARFLAGLLFGITAHDPLTFIVVPLGLLGVALLAAYLPARRATRIDPNLALRYE